MSDIEDLERQLSQCQEDLIRSEAALVDAICRREEAEAERDQARNNAAEASRAYNSPVTTVFLEGVANEAAHQVSEWGVDHDAGKSPSDWFWLVGHLAGKALHAEILGDTEKALHHTISSGALLMNWHAFMLGERGRMRPGIAPPEEKDHD